MQNLELEHTLLIEAQKDIKNFDKLYKYFLNDVYRFSYSILNNQHDAEDITSEVFIEFYKRINIYQWHSITIKNWLFTTAKNLSYKKFRIKSDDSFDENTTIPEQAEISFVDEIMNKEILEQVKKEILKLSSIEQQIINLRIWEGLGFAEISVIVGLSTDTTQKKFYRSLIKIRTALENKGNKNFAALPMLYTAIYKAGQTNSYNAPISLAKLTINSLIYKSKTTIMLTTIKSFLLSKMGIATIVALTIITATTAAAINYKVNNNKSNGNTSTAQNVTPTPTGNTNTDPTPTTDPNMISYYDQNFDIALNYPKGWTIKSTPMDNTLNYGAIPCTDARGTTFDGQLIPTNSQNPSDNNLIGDCNGTVKGGNFTMTGPQQQSIRFEMGPGNWYTADYSSNGGSCTGPGPNPYTINVQGSKYEIQYHYSVGLDPSGPSKDLLDCYQIPGILTGHNSNWKKFFISTNVTTDTVNSIISVLNSITYPYGVNKVDVISPTTTSTKQTTTGWKTYYDSTYDFSFSYPPTWTVKSNIVKQYCQGYDTKTPCSSTQLQNMDFLTIDSQIPAPVSCKGTGCTSTRPHNYSINISAGQLPTNTASGTIDDPIIIKWKHYPIVFINGPYAFDIRRLVTATGDKSVWNSVNISGEPKDQAMYNDMKTILESITSPGINTYDISLIDTGGFFSLNSIQINKNDKIKFSLDSLSTESFFVVITDSSQKTIDSFGSNLETSGSNHIPYTSNVFSKPGTYTVHAQNCMNTQCLSGYGEDLATMQVIVQ